MHAAAVEEPDRRWAERLARYEMIVDASDDAIISTDENRLVLTWNPSASRIFGYRADEVIGRSLRMLAPPDRAAEYAMVSDRVRRGEHIVQYETVCRRKDGALLAVSLTLSPLQDADGSVIGVAIAARIITDRARLQQESAGPGQPDRQLREERDRLQQIMELMPAAVIIYDPIGRRVAANRMALSWNGSAAAQGAVLDGAYEFRRADGSAYAPDDVPVVRARRGEVVMGESMFVRNTSTKTEIPVLASVTPVLAKDGTRQGIVAVFQDISAIKHVEQEREQLLAQVRQALAERELQAALIEQAHDALIVREPSGSIITWNNGATAMYGWKPAEARGHTTHDLLLTRVLAGIPGVAPGTGTGIDTDAVLMAQGSFEGELEHTRRDGTRIVAHSRQVLLRDKAGQASAILEINRDVTARKRAEAERDRLLEGERTARIAAERAVQMRDEFLATAAHELKTPLTGLRGFAQILLRRAEHGTLDGERTREALRGIERETHQLAQLVARLLDVARIETGRLILEPTLTDVVRICREIVAALQPADDAMQTLTLETPGCVWAEVDPLRVAQVVGNLLDNAIKFSPAGGPITSRSRPRTPLRCALRYATTALECRRSTGRTSSSAMLRRTRRASDRALGWDCSSAAR